MIGLKHNWLIYLLATIFCVVASKALANEDEVTIASISTDDILLVEDSTTNVDIRLNKINFVAFQMDLTLPAGISIDRAGCFLSSRVTGERQELTIGRLEDCVYRLIFTSLSLISIGETDDILLSLRLTGAEECEGGMATISNIRFSTSDSNRIILNDESFYIQVLHKYAITYMVDGEVYKTEEIVETTPLIPMEEPVKEGYTFSGWDEIPETMPAQDVVVYGNFTVNKYQVTFVYGDEVLRTDSVEYGAEIPLPVSLESERYTLVEWLDVPETMPAHDIIIYANYTDGIDATWIRDREDKVYDLNGRRRAQARHGFNIIQKSDNVVKRVLVK